MSWCQSQYSSSLANYVSLGVSTNRLILGEHFAHSTNNTGYGRSGVSSNDWDRAIIARSQAAKNLDFAGFIGYAWGADGMNVSQEEMIPFEDTYATNRLPRTTGVTLPYIIEQPQSQIYFSTGHLYQAKRPNELAGKPQVADGKVFHRTLGLRAVIGPGRHADGAHRIVFGAVLGHAVRKVLAVSAGTGPSLRSGKQPA